MSQPTFDHSSFPSLENSIRAQQDANRETARCHRLHLFEIQTGLNTKYLTQLTGFGSGKNGQYICTTDGCDHYLYKKGSESRKFAYYYYFYSGTWKEESLDIDKEN